MTAHNTAKKDDIAKVVIMPGDPLRAKWIAENFLTDTKLVNEVRGMLAYTGTYKGKKITIMGHGMGIPSIGIYSHELFAKELYDVDAIIRIGSAGSWSEKIGLGEVIICDEAVSFSTYAKFIGIEYKDTYEATPKLTEIAKKLNTELNLNATVGKIYSSDVFYGDKSITIEDNIKKTNGALGAEMEIYALYANAIRNKKDAIGFVTISDTLIGGRKEMSPEDRQTSFKAMVTLGLETALKYMEK